MTHLRRVPAVGAFTAQLQSTTYINLRDPIASAQIRKPGEYHGIWYKSRNFFPVTTGLHVSLTSCLLHKVSHKRKAPVVIKMS